MSSDVTRWSAAALKARERAGLDADELPLSVILAIVDVESDGDPTAHRLNAQFYGLTQVGALAAIDGGLISSDEYDQLRADIKAAKGAEARTAAKHALSDWRRRAAAPAMNPDAALLTFCRCVKRYKKYTHYKGASILEGVAIMWKGGAGTAERVRDDVRGGADPEDAMLAREVAPRHTIPRLREYVRRARVAHALYAHLDTNHC